jgi:hypothetical protein
MDRDQRANTGWRAMELPLLAAIVVGGLLCRLYVAFHAPWYWDEGYMAELARALGTLHRPALGALWQDGFFPLSTSMFAPLSAAPLAVGPWWSAMLGVRIWAVILEALALGLTARLAGGAATHGRALIAAAAYAFLPFAVQHGGRGFYHHLAVLFVLLTLLEGRKIFGPVRPGSWALPSLCAGLAFACCYWLWWLPLSWILLVAAKRPAAWLGALAWMALPPALALLVSLWPDPAGAMWSMRCLLHTSGIGGPHSLADWGRDLGANFAALPFLGLGLAGLGWAAKRDGGAWAWYLLCLACATLEPMRQRGDIAVMPYPFIPAAPLAALGAAYLADAVLELRNPWIKGGALALALLLFFKPLDLGWMGQWCFGADKVAELQDFMGKHGRPEDLVCGLPNFNWALEPAHRACEPFDVGAAEGRPSGYYPPPVPASRFATPCGLGAVRYAVVTRTHLLGIFRFEGVALTFLQMERQGWPLVFDDRTFKVYENPKFGVKADPATRIVQAPDCYRTAWKQALAAGRPDLAAFAASRAGETLR